MLTGEHDVHVALRDGFDHALSRTVGRWDICPLWVLRGKMFTLAEKALIIALLDAWHTFSRASWFKATEKHLAGLMGTSLPTFRKARHGLMAKQILKCRPGRQHDAAAYHFSQDFLYTLLKDKTPPLKTSTSSCRQESFCLDGVQSERIFTSDHKG